MKHSRGTATDIAGIFVCLAFALAACSKSASTPTEVSALALTEESRASLERAFGTYEEIRQHLARDQFELSSQAHQLSQDLSRASERVPPSVQPLLASFAEAATRLADTPKEDPQAVRNAFAAVSRAAVALVGADAALGAGRQVYECPMVEGYGRWIQVGGETSNPYMGARMPRCGTMLE